MPIKIVFTNSKANLEAIYKFYNIYRMIERHWTGVVFEEKVADYIAHLQKDTFPQLNNIKGFQKASILQRTLADGEEFLIVTQWESMDAIQQFAGSDATQAVVPPEAATLMLRFDQEVRHYTVAHTTNAQ